MCLLCKALWWRSYLPWGRWRIAASPLFTDLFYPVASLPALPVSNYSVVPDSHLSRSTQKMSFLMWQLPPVIWLLPLFCICFIRCQSIFFFHRKVKKIKYARLFTSTMKCTNFPWHFDSWSHTHTHTHTFSHRGNLSRESVLHASISVISIKSACLFILVCFSNLRLRKVWLDIQFVSSFFWPAYSVMSSLKEHRLNRHLWHISGFIWML